MNQQNAIEAIFTLPPGRLVWGSVYRPQTHDRKTGQQLVYKSGAKKGQPAQRWSIGVAIAKQGEQNWWQTGWGQQILAIGQQGFVNGAWQRQDFSWKITDGDSTVPNKEGKIPSQTPHNRGHWIIAMQTYVTAPPVYRAAPGTRDFQQVVGEEGFVKAGYFVEVNIKVEPNDGQTPGVYIAPRMVAFVGYGEEIQQGPDASQAGFGQQPLPQGAMAAPVGGFNPSAGAGIMPGMAQPQPMGMQQVPGAMQGMQQPMAQPQPMQQMGIGQVNGAPQLPGAGVMQQQPAMAMNPTGLPVQQQMPAQTMVQPNPQFLQMPGAQPQPMGMQPQPMMQAQQPGVGMMPQQQMQPQAQPRRVMTQLANGATYEQFIAGGYNDQTLLAQGLMVYQ